MSETTIEPETTALTVMKPAQAVPTQQESYESLMALAKELTTTGFLPQAVKTPAQAVAIILTGRELGLGPMQSLRSICIIQGKPELAADLQLSIFHRDGGRSKWLALLDTKAVLWLRHPNGDEHTEQFTIEDAKRAGLANGVNWQKYPKAMLRSRAITAGLKSIGFEPLAGAYAPGEIGGPEIVGPEPEPIVETPAALPALTTPTPAKPLAPKAPADRKTRIEGMAFKLGNLVPWAVAYLRQFTADGGEANSALMPNEDLTALNDEQVNYLALHWKDFMARLEGYVKANEGSDLAPESVTPKADAAAAETSLPDSRPRIVGYIKATNKKETKKPGKFRYGILITEDMNTRDGGTWLNTFSETDFATAGQLTGKRVEAIYSEGQYGNELEHGGLTEV